MRELLLQPTPLSHWYHLVNEAEIDSSLELGEELESYLVFLLMRYSKRPELAKSILALEFLESLKKLGSDRCSSLQEVGDKCLIYSGLFPEQIKRRRLKESYYIDLGQDAYHMLAVLSRLQLANLYQNLCEGFLMMRDVLLAIRQQEKEFVTLKKITTFRKPITKH